MYSNEQDYKGIMITWVNANGFITYEYKNRLKTIMQNTCMTDYEAILLHINRRLR